MEQLKLDNTKKEGSKASLNEFLDSLLKYQSEPESSQINAPKKVEKANKTEIVGNDVGGKNEIKNYPTLNIKSDNNKEGKYIIYLF